MGKEDICKHGVDREEDWCEACEQSEMLKEVMEVEEELDIDEAIEEMMRF